MQDTDNLEPVMSDPKIREAAWSLLEADLAKRLPRVLAAN